MFWLLVRISVAELLRSLLIPSSILEDPALEMLEDPKLVVESLEDKKLLVDPLHVDVVDPNLFDVDSSEGSDGTSSLLVILLDKLLRCRVAELLTIPRCRI
jgi:hypothetical protein